jgi:hypothetical protein
MHHRRDFLFRTAGGLGAAALSTLLHQEARAASLEPKKPHIEGRAKACIFLTMEGGPSHIDTFDPKPKLAQLHMTEFVRQSKFASAMESGRRYYVQTPFEFRKAGQSGIDMCTEFEHLAGVADDLCVFRGGVAESPNHPTALYQLNTGNKFTGDPSMGAWATYGLGTMNQNLPAFVVMPDLAFPQGGAANWGNGFLPAMYQGTPLRPSGSPVLDMEPPEGVDAASQRENLDALRKLNQFHAAEHPDHKDLQARIDSYELAFRMQSEMPGAVDLKQEGEATRKMYGIGEKETDGFGRRCLLARRLVERGVRFVQVYASGWDSHDYLENAHRSRIKAVDKPIAGLIRDLKSRGLLDSTLIVWGGEFGRSPDNGIRKGSAVWGRDHNPQAMSMWFAGAKVRSGNVVGATDEIGAKAVEEVHNLRDIHVTILHLMGLDDARLTYFHAGRYRQLSQFGGQVIKGITG